ncbi:substrate-binding domain-containing protein [Sporomusa sp.]|uniref:substrate-binding domain-containing protein n=1 Tax=Sporomusa sp. TaxID=2078658 RepID=UPI002CCC3092|nr:substrate-binding domain-containing protein [Sporomusa sp.]HWR43787.1 substrate-binding domain-containing protein [Sporomusa sp.]
MRKTGKMWLVISLVFAMVIGAVGCGSQQPAAADKADAKKEIVIGLSFPAADHGWLGAIIKNAEDEAKAQGVKYIITTADNPNKQTSDIEDLITKKVSAIVMLPIESASMTPVAKKIKAANIPLIVVDREIESDDFTAVVKGDNKGIGINGAKFIADKLKGKGNVVIISAPPSSVNTLRTGGFEETIKAFPDIKVLAMQDGGFQKEKGYTVMQNMLQAHKQIDAVFTLDDEMALGAIKAIKEAKRTDIKLLTGAGGNKEYYEMIKNEKDIEMTTFIYSPLMVKDGVKLAVNILKGNTPKEKVTVIPANAITRENVDKYYDAKANY